MYSVAISVASCLRAQTRVNVVWVVDGQGIPGLDLTEGVALTPGGGRMGSLANGAFDTQLVELATATSGRIVELQVGDVEALISGLPKGSRATLAVMPADQMPTHLWQALIERQRVCLDAQLEDGRIVSLVAHHDRSEEPHV